MIERRQYPRYAKRLEVQYSTLGLASVESSSVTRNVSKAGLRLQLSRLIKKGDALKIKISPPDQSSSPITAMGKVVWTKESDSFEFDAGLRFTKIAPADAERLIAIS